MGFSEADKGYMSLVLYEAMLASEKALSPNSIVIVENGIIAVASNHESKSGINELIQEYEHRIKEEATLYTFRKPEGALSGKIGRIVYALGKEGQNGGLMQEEALKIMDEYRFRRSKHGFLENSLPF